MYLSRSKLFGLGLVGVLSSKMHITIRYVDAVYKPLRFILHFIPEADNSTNDIYSVIEAQQCHIATEIRMPYGNRDQGQHWLR